MATTQCSTHVSQLQIVAVTATNGQQCIPAADAASCCCVCIHVSALPQVSHDQMRDHVWSMLRPKHMLKWRQRHVIDFFFSFNKDAFYPLEPKPYTPCVQEVRPGVWLLPSTEGPSEAGQDRWLLCQAQPV